MTNRWARLQMRRHPLKGRIVVAAGTFEAGELVCISRPRAQADSRDSYSVQVDWNRHIYIDEPGEVFSHSCEPSLSIKSNQAGGYDFYAIRPLVSGDEMTWHYGTAESEILYIPACGCGAGGCLGKGVGFTEATPDQQAQLYRIGLADYLCRYYEDSLGLAPIANS